MSEFKIEKSIPMPKYPSYRRYPFGDMEIGDSIFIDKKVAAPYKFAKNHNWKFVVRKEGDGFRIWRVA